jgi:hypothetical protein
LLGRHQRGEAGNASGTGGKERYRPQRFRRTRMRSLVQCPGKSALQGGPGQLGAAHGRSSLQHWIQCREDYDTLLELEQMGGKIRDTEDEYVGAEGRDDKTKFMISPRYGTIHSYFPDPRIGQPNFNPPETRNNVVIRVWGSTFKPVLKKECRRLGVKIFDRVMGTGLLTENGIQGARVIGATGLNTRTGEFMIFKSKATILSTAGAGSIWFMSMELGGFSNMHSRAISGDGTVMAFKAGAEPRVTSTSGTPVAGMPVMRMCLLLTPKESICPILSRAGWMPALWFRVREWRRKYAKES